MISMTEVARGLTGAIELARGNPSGLGYFDDSRHGFWQSFWAAGLVAPLHLTVSLLYYTDAELAAGPGLYLLVEALTYVIGWTAFPVVMLSLTQVMGKTDKYIRTIVAYNWAGALQTVALFPISVLIHAETAIPPDAIRLLYLILLIAVLVYIGFVMSTALEIPALAASGFVLLDFALSVTIQTWSHQLVS